MTLTALTPKADSSDSFNERMRQAMDAILKRYPPLRDAPLREGCRLEPASSYGADAVLITSAGGHMMTVDLRRRAWRAGSSCHPSDADRTLPSAAGKGAGWISRLLDAACADLEQIEVEIRHRNERREALGER